MTTYRFTTVIGAPQDLVFDLWTDLDRLSEWTEGVTKVTDVNGSPRQAGARYTVWFGRFPSPTEVLEAVPPRFIKTRFGSRVLRGTNSAAFEGEGDRTRLVQEFEVEGITSRIMARLFATGSYKGSFRGELEAFRRLAEHEARTAASSGSNHS